MEIKVKGYAKINLTFDITGKRPDGYHEVKTVMQTVGLYDTVTLCTNESGEITVGCDHPEVPCDERNIAVKCAKSFFDKTGIQYHGLHIEIEKRIPTQAGLAGGSTDGAAVLKGLNELYGNPLRDEELLSLGAKTGADVPFCIMGGTALGVGTGTILTRLNPIPHTYFVLVKPPFGVSTKEAFEAVDNAAPREYYATDRMLECLDDVKLIGKNLRNDFEETLHNEPLLKLKSKLLECDGALGAVMTGSGSTVYAVFDDKKKAKACKEKFLSEYNDVFLAENVIGEQR